MPSFEEHLKALESIVAKLEGGDLPLEDSVRLFEEGMKLSDACKKDLDVAEGKIQAVVDGGRGKMKLVDLDEAAGVEKGGNGRD
jgi:exodeoxyribonuclease VII small subunit